MTLSNLSNPEDAKLETLARATQLRTNSEQAAALRDTTGRTYVGINISIPEFTVDAATSVFTVAMASQISGIEAIVIFGEGPVNIAPARGFASKCLIWRIDSTGEITAL